MFAFLQKMHGHAYKMVYDSDTAVNQSLHCTERLKEPTNMNLK